MTGTVIIQSSAEDIGPPFRTGIPASLYTSSLSPFYPIIYGVIAEHPRCYGRNELICDPWHYLPVLEKRKPGALRHGAPFRQWDLLATVRVVRDRLLKQEKGDRAFVELLLMARALGETGLETLEVACDLTFQTGVIAAAIVLNEMRRFKRSDKT